MEITESEAPAAKIKRSGCRPRAHTCATPPTQPSRVVDTAQGSPRTMEAEVLGTPRTMERYLEAVATDMHPPVGKQARIQTHRDTERHEHEHKQGKHTHRADALREEAVVVLDVVESFALSIHDGHHGRI